MCRWFDSTSGHHGNAVITLLLDDSSFSKDLKIGAQLVHRYKTVHQLMELVHNGFCIHPNPERTYGNERNSESNYSTYLNTRILCYFQTFPINSLICCSSSSTVAGLVKSIKDILSIIAISSLSIVSPITEG